MAEITATEDNGIRSNTATTNRGTATDAWLGDASAAADAAARLLVKFDLSGIPSGATITAAELEIYLQLQTGVASSTWYARRLLRNWTEGGSTWNTYDGTNAWTTAGASSDGNDRVGTASGTASVNATTGEYKAFSGQGLIDDVQGWLDGDFGNCGWLISSSAEYAGATPQTYHTICTAEGTNPPKLIVTYTTGSGAGIMTTLRGIW